METKTTPQTSALFERVVPMAQREARQLIESLPGEALGPDDAHLIVYALADEPDDLLPTDASQRAALLAELGMSTEAEGLAFAAGVAYVAARCVLAVRSQEGSTR